MKGNLYRILVASLLLVQGCAASRGRQALVDTNNQNPLPGPSSPAELPRSQRIFSESEVSEIQAFLNKKVGTETGRFDSDSARVLITGRVFEIASKKHRDVQWENVSDADMNEIKNIIRNTQVSK